MSSRRRLRFFAAALGVLALAALLAVTLTRSEPGAGADGALGSAPGTLTANAPGPISGAGGRAGDAAPGTPTDRPAAEDVAADRELVVYRSPGCVCCERWAEHMAEHGFSVRIEEPADLLETKREHGVRRSVASCHTAVVDGYVIEGHVPADLVLRLLEERPDVRGLVVPGMPVGSPGMEGANPESYDVFTFDDEGGISIYARR